MNDDSLCLLRCNYTNTGCPNRRAFLCKHIYGHFAFPKTSGRPERSLRVRNFYIYQTFLSVHWRTNDTLTHNRIFTLSIVKYLPSVNQHCRNVRIIFKQLFRVGVSNEKKLRVGGIVTRLGATLRRSRIVFDL